MVKRLVSGTFNINGGTQGRFFLLHGVCVLA